MQAAATLEVPRRSGVLMAGGAGISVLSLAALHVADPTNPVLHGHVSDYHWGPGRPLLPVFFLSQALAGVVAARAIPRAASSRTPLATGLWLGFAAGMAVAASFPTPPPGAPEGSGGFVALAHQAGATVAMAGGAAAAWAGTRALSRTWDQGSTRAGYALAAVATVGAVGFLGALPPGLSQRLVVLGTAGWLAASGIWLLRSRAP